MDKRYEVFLSHEAQSFYDTLGSKEQRKIDFVIDKVEMNLFGDWFKKLKSSDGIWEFVVDYGGIFHRLLSFFDTIEPNDPLIIATHGFKKKQTRLRKRKLKKQRELKLITFQNKINSY